MEDPLWQLFRAVVDRGAEAWQPLVAELDPVLSGMARRQPLGRLRDREDTPRDIVTRVLARLHRREFEAIHKLCALKPEPELRAWLRVMVRRSAIDYMRESPEYDRGNDERDDRWISIATLSSRVAAPADTFAAKRAEVLAFVRDACTRAGAEVAASDRDEAISRLALEWKIDRTHVRRLVARAGRYMEILTAVFEGQSYPDIAARLGLTRREVELTVRYLEEFLAARGFART